MWASSLCDASTTAGRFSKVDLVICDGGVSFVLRDTGKGLYIWCCATLSIRYMLNEHGYHVEQERVNCDFDILNRPAAIISTTAEICIYIILNSTGSVILLRDRYTCHNTAVEQCGYGFVGGINRESA